MAELLIAEGAHVKYIVSTGTGRGRDLSELFRGGTALAALWSASLPNFREPALAENGRIWNADVPGPVEIGVAAIGIARAAADFEPARGQIAEVLKGSTFRA